MNTGGAVVLAIVLLLLAAAIGWVIFTRVRASQLGLPPPPWKSYIPFLNSSSSGSYGGPAPAPGGITGWLSARVRALRNRNTRTAAGAYEGSAPYNAGYASTGGGNNANPHARGFDEDDAWDSRVGGYNPYEEERELGLVPPAHGGHGGHGQGYVHGQGQTPGEILDGEGYQMNLAVATPAAAHGGGALEEEPRGRTRSRSPGPPAAVAGRLNPFGDEAEPSNMDLRGVSPRPMEGDASFAGRKARGEHDDRRSVFREEV